MHTPHTLVSSYLDPWKSKNPAQALWLVTPDLQVHRPFGQTTRLGAPGEGHAPSKTNADTKGASTLGEIFSRGGCTTSASPGVFLLRTFRRVRILARPGEGFSQKPKLEKRDSRGEAGEGTRIRARRVCGEGEAFSAQCEHALRAGSAAVQMCLEMAIAVALRNRDRLLLIWPHIHEFLAAILAPSQVHGKDDLAQVIPRQPLPVSVPVKRCSARVLRANLLLV